MIEVLKQALEVNESMKDVLKQVNELIAENKSLKEALAQPTPAEYAMGYAEGFNDGCKPDQEPVGCAECERLKDALKRANGLAKHFERAWYLRGDEIEQLKAQRTEQEPWCMKMNGCTAKCEDCPDEPPPTPQRTWVGLAAEDRLTAKYMQDAPDGIQAVIDYIEAKLKQKNGYADSD